MKDSEYSNLLMLFGLVLYKVSETGFQRGLWMVFSLFFLVAAIIEFTKEQKSE